MQAHSVAASGYLGAQAKKAWEVMPALDSPALDSLNKTPAKTWMFYGLARPP